jgi:hypothetical protein
MEQVKGCGNGAMTLALTLSFLATSAAFRLGVGCRWHKFMRTLTYAQDKSHTGSMEVKKRRKVGFTGSTKVLTFTTKAQ